VETQPFRWVEGFRPGAGDKPPPGGDEGPTGGASGGPLGRDFSCAEQPGKDGLPFEYSGRTFGPDWWDEQLRRLGTELLDEYRQVNPSSILLTPTFYGGTAYGKKKKRTTRRSQTLGGRRGEGETSSTKTGS